MTAVLRRYENGRLPHMDAAQLPQCMAAALPQFSSDAMTEYILFPGFVDVHVHLREPGFCYKESIASGSRAAAHGGYSTVCSMPNLDPTPDSLPHLQLQLDKIAETAVINVLPYGTITKGELGEELADLEALAPYVCAFSDDGRGVQNEEMMRRAMLEAKRLGKMIVAHCEDNSLLGGAHVHDGAYARSRGWQGISSASEWKQVERDLQLVRETGCSYHICHVSTKESVALIRQAKAEGLDVTAETAPHYLLLTEDDLIDEGRFKMNPPLREKADREALLQGVIDGTIDIIATDHAPHSDEEKSRGLQGSPMGIVGLETAFPLLYTYLVKEGKMSLRCLIEALSEKPRRRFGIRDNGWTLFDLNAVYKIDTADFLSWGHATPFAGWEVQGRCLMTAQDGRLAWCAK